MRCIKNSRQKESTQMDSIGFYCFHYMLGTLSRDNSNSIHHENGYSKSSVDILPFFWMAEFFF